ncbi:MAG: sigma-54-dependent transcriptional regulator [Promethearchaeota archaeon]
METAMSYVPKILIVDDEKRMCDSLTVLLSHEGYETHTSLTGMEAVESLSRDDFDLVLLDMVMPDISGPEVMKHVRNLNPETPVIVITGYGSLDSALKAMRWGAFDYMRKPLDFDELLVSVQKAVQQRMQTRERGHGQTIKRLRKNASILDQ